MIYLISFFHECLFAAPGSHPGYRIAFSCHVSLGPSRRFLHFKQGLTICHWTVIPAKEPGPPIPMEG